MANKLLSMCRKDLVSIYKHAIDAVGPEKLIKSSVSIEGNTFMIRDALDHCSNTIGCDISNSNIHVVGGGKCVLAMAKGLAKIAVAAQADHLFSHGCISVPTGLKSSLAEDPESQELLSAIKTSCLFGSADNLPDEGSVLASQQVLRLVVEACVADKSSERQSLFIVLLSGGGSACLTSPRGVNLQTKLKLIKSLVQRGANIVELNTVRRCYSNIKGGRLVKHILQNNSEARIITLILSDVIGDPIKFIASGPTFVDWNEEVTQEMQSMIDILAKYDIHNVDMPTEIDGPMKDHQALEVQNGSVINKVIGNNQIALNAAIEKAQSLGYNVQSLGAHLDGPTHKIVEKIIRESSRWVVTDQSQLLICGGEATVEKLQNETWGKGGRCQEMALDYMISKLTDDRKTDDQKNTIDIFLAGGTDGQDGPTDVAACIASHMDWSINRNFDLGEALEAKKSHNSFHFFNQKKPDWLVRTGLTGTNVMDLYMFLNAPSVARGKY